MKTIGNLRGMVKNWLGYLQQADRALDTISVTTNSLKESGVLDKLIKHRGKNLSTDDFTNILAALMSSPLASGFLGGGSSTEEPEAKESTPPPSTQQQPRQLPPGAMQPMQPQLPGQPYAPPPNNTLTQQQMPGQL